ncbi:MAG: adenylyltransferase/cytidyltransferase family protein, partial [Bdellovibrionota bacterium]
MKFKTAVVIGRFQPFHAGHQELIESALTLAEKVVIVVGSAGAARNLRNPFTADERIEMMKLNVR